MARHPSSVSGGHAATLPGGPELDAATFNDGWAKAEQARKVCEKYREKLFHHRHEHGCFTARGS
jgi:hypothetical protein